MGTYNVGIQEIKDKVSDSLDVIEGDFSRETLGIALGEVAKE